MGMLGVIDLVASSSRPARSLAARQVPEAAVRRSTISYTLSPAPQPSLSSRAHSVFSSSSSSCGSDPGAVYDEDHANLSEAPPTPMGRQPGRHPRRTVGRARTESVAERQGVLTVLMSSALRRLVGERTRADVSTGTGMMAKVMGSSDATSRFLFCVVGPRAVDLAALWFSPNGKPLCSCWGHTQNVALLVMTGEASSCWHAHAFQAAVDDLAGSRLEIVRSLQVRDDTKPYSVDIKTNTGMAAAAFDGSIYSAVIANRRRDVKCVAVSCRANPRRCHHAELVKGLARLVVPADPEADISDVSSDGERHATDQRVEAEDGDVDVDDDDLVQISKARQKRNLLACEEEDKQGIKWARTAEWAADDLAATPVWLAHPSEDNKGTEGPSSSITVLQQMARLGLVFDPAVTLHETTCSMCGAAKSAETTLIEVAGKLFCDGNSSEPLSVRFCIVVWRCIAYLMRLPFLFLFGSLYLRWYPCADFRSVLSFSSFIPLPVCLSSLSDHLSRYPWARGSARGSMSSSTTEPTTVSSP